LRDTRARKVAHGDVKAENVLVTSWNSVHLSDFAPYKPTYIPLDDPADFDFFFDTSGRRTCYLAPERFFAADDPAARARKTRLPEDDGITASISKDGKVTEPMDVFGAGCVLAELFRDGTPLFTLAQLFRYRAGELNIDVQLGEIDDSGMRVSSCLRHRLFHEGRLTQRRK
jgi:phosphoinositide-3-kinase regulatory subunit 4